jgi:hypothetical protein
MKIITWNCRKGGFERKYLLIKRLGADIIVVPECNNVEISGASRVWVDSDNKKNQGIAVFAFNGYRLVLAEKPLSKGGAFLPVKIYLGKKYICNLLAVWPRSGDKLGYKDYVGKTLFALKKYGAFIKSTPTVVAGDFNSHDQWTSHDDLLSATEGLGLVSAYHEFYMFRPGEEEGTTYYHHYKDSHNKYKSPFHIDYVFIPLIWRRKIQKIKIGSKSTLKNGRPVQSDHLPLIVDINL